MKDGLKFVICDIGAIRKNLRPFLHGLLCPEPDGSDVGQTSGGVIDSGMICRLAEGGKSGDWS